MPEPHEVEPDVSLTRTEGTPNQRQISSIWNLRLESSSMSCGDMEIGSNFMPFSNYREFLKAIENPAQIFMPDVPGVVLSPQKRSDKRKLFTTKSTVFSIYATATVGRVTKRIQAVVDMANDVTLALPEEQTATASGGKVLYYRME